MIKTKSTFFILAIVLFLFKFSQSQTIEVQGYSFLENNEFSNDIKVKFERIAPTYLIDSVFTDSSGYYLIELDAGIYKVEYSKTGYIEFELPDMSLYQNTTIPDQTLETIGLSGSLSGILAEGVYKIGGDIIIEAANSLIIEPGTILEFKEDIMFQVYGELIAEGTYEDTIKFTNYNNGEFWKGIDFKENASDNSIINYCIVEHSNDRGISIFKCSPSVRNSIIQYNIYDSSVTGQDEDEGGGAGICLKYSNTLIKNVIVRNNYGKTTGCGIFCNDGNPRISNSLIINNVNPHADEISGRRSGGGVFCSYDAHLTIENTIICFNTNSVGGGICLAGFYDIFIPELTVVNSIIYENISPSIHELGGGIATYDETTLSVINSLIWNNEGGNFSCDDPWLGVNVTINNNLDSCDAYGNLIMSPLFVSPALYDFNLAPDSPCIDAGNNNYVTSEIDFIHNYRIWDGNYDNDTIVDIGSYEYDSQFNPVGIANDESEKIVNILVYPNPTKDFINVSIDNVCRIEIYDNSGRLVLLTKEVRIDISQLKPGHYFLKILDVEQNYYSEKIIKY